jgi:NAD(P)-dependent dehydrogenase (short-subunit alcohol dehydrogenase family)
MRFTNAQIDLFARLSHDTNPLHCDPTYAAATPFGRVVVHGVCGVLCALGAWADGRRFALRRLRATFRKPLFLGEDYELSVNEAGERVTLRWTKDGEPHADLSLTFRPWETSQPSPEDPFTPRAEAGHVAPRDLASVAGDLPYAIDSAAFPAMKAALGLAWDQMPPSQLAALCGSSYLIGMEVPGRQALFSDIDMKFGENPGPTFQGLTASYDPRFNRVVLTGTGRALASFQLGSFRRPETGRSLDVVERAVGRSKRYAGKTVVVTGSSRGFGATLTKAFALQGANVVVHYREREEQARQTAAELAGLTDPLLIGADLSRDADCQRFASAVLARFGRVDLLVHSAVPTIAPHPYLEQTTDELAGYVARALAVVAGPSRALLPSMADGAVVASVSSVYAREPPPGYAHYSAAKGAVETFTHALAREFPALAFVVVRPPRLVPDDAGVSGGAVSAGAWAAVSPADVAASFLARLEEAPTPGRCEVVDLD